MCEPSFERLRWQEVREKGLCRESGGRGRRGTDRGTEGGAGDVRSVRWAEAGPEGLRPFAQAFALDPKALEGFLLECEPEVFTRTL